MPGSSVLAGLARDRVTGTQNAFAHTVRSLRIRPSRLCKLGPHEGFANPVTRSHAGLYNFRKLNEQKD
jgi:hypothetical protein